MRQFLVMMDGLYAATSESLPFISVGRYMKLHFITHEFYY